MAKHVLIVDDQAEVLEVLGIMLEELGFRVSAVDGGAGMRKFLNKAEPVDLVVLDRRMPGEDGTTLAFYAQHDLGLPVLMISGDIQNIESAERPNLKLLRKPFKFQELQDAVAQLVPANPP